MDNAFESTDSAIPEVEDPIKAASIAKINAEVARIQAINEGLRQMGLFNTVDINVRKIHRLLSEKRELEDDAARE